MIITRTPFRISFFGGGTDYPAWYKKNGGAVLSTSIDKYCYITCRYLSPFFKYKYRIIYSKLEETDNRDEIDHPSARECIGHVNPDMKIMVAYDADVSARSGLGSSSSFTVGLLNALYGLEGKKKTKTQLATEALHVEQNLIKENVGSQDQVVAAFGGLNKIEFGEKKDFKVLPIAISQEKLNFLQNHLMLFFTGFSRTASEIAAEQIKLIPQKGSELKTMRQMVDKAINILHDKNKNLDDFGKLLHESWQLKKSLSSQISNSAIDNIYDAGHRAGALGGKLLGAGGGGFMLFFVPPERHKKIKEKLAKFPNVPFRIEHSGSQIIYHSPQILANQT